MKPDEDAPSPGSANPGPSQRSPGPAQDPAAFFRQLGEQTSKVLTAAEEAAQEIREQARRDAAVVLADARMQSDELARAAAAERRAAEEELRRFREARAILANQIEDVRRRLEEIILRLRTPVDAPDSVGSQPEAAADQAASAGQATGEEPRRAPAVETHEASRPGAATRSASAPEPAAAKAGGASALDRRDSREIHRVEDVERREGAKAPAPADAPRPGGRVAGEVAARARAEGLTGQKPTAPVPDAVQERLDTTPAAVPIPAPVATGGNRAAAPNGTAAIGVPAFAPPSEVADEPPGDSPQAEAFQRRAEALGDIPLAAARSLKRLLQEDQNDLLDRIRRSRGRGSFEQDILPAEVQLDRFGHGLRTVLDPAFLKGRSLGGAPNIGESPDPIGSLV
ncbi:MAG TPA: hypothetical protein VHA57_08420, partial [Actinomycetota bacterium]|nr:hypothetical protein [Actinomycetota bacterium]